MRVGFIGLGSQGAPMARCIVIGRQRPTAASASTMRAGVNGATAT